MGRFRAASGDDEDGNGGFVDVVPTEYLAGDQQGHHTPSESNDSAWQDNSYVRSSPVSSIDGDGHLRSLSSLVPYTGDQIKNIEANDPYNAPNDPPRDTSHTGGGARRPHSDAYARGNRNEMTDLECSEFELWRWMNQSLGSERRVHGHVIGEGIGEPHSPSHPNYESQTPESQLFPAQVYGSPYQYHDGPDWEIGRPARRRNFLTIRNVALVAFAGIALSYLSTRAPPPPPHDTWGTYILSSSQLYFSGVKRASIDVAFTLNGLFTNIYRDAVDIKSSLAHVSVGQGKGETSRCALMVPSHNPISHPFAEDLLAEEIVGQTKALRTIFRALDGWEIAMPDGDNSASCGAVGKPLVTLFSGPEGVGKSETAKRISRMLFGHCRSKTLEGVLEIDGQTHSDDSFRDTVINHVRHQNGFGAVFTVRHIESMSPSTMAELVRLVKSPDPLLQDQSGRPLRWNNVLFLLTTDLGAGKLFKSVSANGGTERIPEDLNSAIRDELDDYFGSSIGLGNAINCVAVFLPMGPQEIERVLRNRVEQLGRQHQGSLWKRLEATDRALRYFSGRDHVDYLSMKKRGSDEIVLTFSKRGAHTLVDGALMQTLRSLRRRLPPRPDLVSVFDFDADSGEAVMVRCEQNDRDGSDRGKCEEAWKDNMR